jgi:DNA-binding transcriptional regulator YiaG
MLNAAAVLRAIMPQKLNGGEIRGLRKLIELSAKELAKQFDVREETISRWENDRTPIPLANEKLLRLTVVAVLSDSAPGIEVDPQMMSR